MTELIITSSVLILVVIVLRHLLKGKISLRLQYALWALVLLRLLVPVTLFESPISVMSAVQAAKYAREASVASSPTPTLSSAYGDMGAENAVIHGAAEQSVINSVTDEYHHVFRWGLLAQWAWYIGIGIVGMTLFLSNLSFGKKLKKNRKAYETDDCKLPVYIVDALASPCLFGFFHPSIYITPEVAGDEIKLRHVLAHELTHYRHGDHIWVALRCLCLTAHWYNPLVWLAAALSRRDSELACDEGTIKRIGEESRMEYGYTLIGLTCEKRKALDLLSTATTMTDGKNGIKERITLIAKKPKVLIPAVISVVLVALIAVGCTFTGAKPENAEIIPLTADEVETYNKVFEPLLYDGHGNPISVNPISQFLTSYYDRPEDINLAELLRYFPSDGDVTDKAEFESLKVAENWPFGTDVTLGDMPVPVHKFFADTVNKALKQYMGITRDDLSGAGMDELVYLKDYDAYYNFTSDAGFGSFVCTSGEKQGDIVSLFGEISTLTLKIQGNGFLIISYQLTEEVTDGSSAADEIGLVADGANVPDTVVAAAKAQVECYFKIACADQPKSEYVNWRIELLDRIYTYEDFDGLTLNIYRMNYEFLSKAPENVVLAGGMYITDDNWVCPTYPNCTYLIFNADDSFYFRAVMENDCEPGDEIFTADLSAMRLSKSALKAAGVGDAIASVDIDKDGKDEHLYLDKTQMDIRRCVTLRIYDDCGYEIWSGDANGSHAGWNSLFLCTLDGDPYLLRYNPEMYEGYCTYTYTLFTLESGVETVHQTNTLEFDINGTKALDTSGMVAFADEINSLLEKSTLLVSSKDGTFALGPASSTPFLETYSWLNSFPELDLYAKGDDLATRLQKYSDYAVSNRAQIN
ncbi:MAG: M56 family metallopeptidase [Oscillospiraceae bacterium]|nr:M56 family metallopeptidase [Oscillospiraceae bacterium]